MRAWQLRGEPQRTRTARQVDVLAAFVEAGGSVSHAAARVGIVQAPRSGTWPISAPGRASPRSS